MMRRAAPFALGFCALALVPLAPAARAQTTPDGAKALEQQIHDWISGTLGPDVSIAQRPVQVTANGDHYDVAIPLGDGPAAPRWTATARESSGGRYAVDDIRIPSPAEFHVKLPDALTQSGAPGITGDITYKVAIGQQTGQMLLDPTFASGTTSTSSVKSVDVQSSGGMAPQTTHIDSANGSFVMQPVADGRLDISIDSNLDGYTITTETPNTGPLTVAFGKAHVTANATSLSRDRTVQMLQAAIKVLKAMSPAPSGTNSDAPSSAVSSAAMLEALAELASGAIFEETLQDMAVNAGGMAGSLRAMQVGFAIKGVDGLLQARLDFGAEGLTLPELGLGAMVDLIPTKFSLSPTLSGVPTDALMALAKASSAGDDPTPDDIMALFAQGPIRAGLETMTIDVGGAEFTGLGKVELASPQDISGTAQITATNLDALQQKIAAAPGLTQAVPVIIFLKGIGRSVGNQMIWDIAYRGGHVLVNNQDLSALTGGGGGPPPDPAPVPVPRPPQTQTAPPAPGPQSGKPLRRRP